MRIPATIKAGGITYSVQNNEDLTDAQNAWGVANHDKQTITMTPDMKPDKEAEVFLHELLHIACNMTDLSKHFEQGLTEEEVVGPLAKAFYTLIADNELDFRAS